ncbi:MAG: B12-binding domain-containing radical SAM protein [Candidatus Omnitrophica bacterium]|nr:B12-binding domain-containing radical SAM protein [Candidatus Omnitrophota bacterium]
MKVLFLNSRASLMYPMEKLGIMILSSLLKQEGHQCENIEPEAVPDLIEVVRQRDPQLIAFSSTTGLHTVYLELARNLKKAFPHIPTIMGGPHPTFMPHVIEHPAMDIICLGEGEMALLELANAMEAGRDYRDIRNLWVKQNGDITRNDLRPFLSGAELDALPFPDRELMAVHADVYKNGTNSVMSGRGCPYKCSYCFNERAQEMAGGRYTRKMSIDRVIAEIQDMIQRCGTRMVAFQDDVLIMNKRWFKEFAPRYRDEVGLPYVCHITIDLVDEEIAEALAISNCKYACYGLENGNEEFRHKMLNKKNSNEEVITGSHFLKQYGVKIITQNMIGFPEETPEITLDTARLNVEAMTDIANFYFFTPYPGTWAGDYCRDAGLLSAPFEDFPVSLHDMPPLDSPYASDFKELSQLIYLGMDYPSLLPLMRYVYTRLDRNSIVRKLAVKAFFALNKNIRSWPYFKNRPSTIPRGIENLA